jgi:hypothetical protein
MDKTNKNPQEEISLGTATTNQSTNVIQCAVRGCRHSFHTAEPVTVNARYICRHHRIGPRWFERHQHFVSSV